MQSFVSLERPSLWKSNAHEKVGRYEERPEGTMVWVHNLNGYYGCMQQYIIPLSLLMVVMMEEINSEPTRKPTKRQHAFTTLYFVSIDPIKAIKLSLKHPLP